MSLTFSCITPHPPIIVPSVGKENLKQVEATINSLKEMEGDLYVSQPDTIFIVSPHSPITPEAFSLNLANEFKGNLKNFGGVEELNLKCDVSLISHIKEQADLDKIPVNIISQPLLDHGVTVPLYYLTQHLSEIEIVPISFSLLDYDTHFKFGKLLHKVASNSNKRIAMVASGDLSHCLTDDAPGGYMPEGKTFDHLLIKFLENNQTTEILKMNPDMIEKAGECGLRSIIILLGILDGLSYKFKKLSYEGPFGVGYLVGEFILS